MNTVGGILGTERILQLTLEIIYLLTGEVYVSKAKSTECITPIIEIPPPMLTPERNNQKKILEVTHKIIGLLTGEVPIRCQDVTVYFSMEEWEYIEGHKDLYKDIMMEKRPPLTSPDGSSNRNPPERCSRPLYSRDSTQQHQEDQVDGSNNRNPTERCLHPQYSLDSTEEHQEIPQEDQKIPHNFKAKREEKDGSAEIEDFNIVVVNHIDAQDLSMKIEEEITSGYKTDDEIGSDGTYKTTSNPHANTGVSMGDKAMLQPKQSNDDQIVKRRTKHSEERPFICAYCGKHFDFKSVFVNHLRIHTGEKPYQCAECGKCFSQKGSLVEHQKIHKGDKPFVCPDCGKCFIQRANLYHHQKNHMNEKPYPCSECGKRFINSSRLAAHEKIHSGYKPFSCPDCGKGFLKNANLIIHQRVHTGEKPFMCSECGKCFIKNSNLVTHMRVHTGEKPFQCLKCGRCFSQSSVLVRHQKTHGDLGELEKVNF